MIAFRPIETEAQTKRRVQFDQALEAWKQNDTRENSEYLEKKEWEIARAICFPLELVSHIFMTACSEFG